MGGELRIEHAKRANLAGSGWPAAAFRFPWSEGRVPAGWPTRSSTDWRATGIDAISISRKRGFPGA